MKTDFYEDDEPPEKIHALAEQISSSPKGTVTLDEIMERLEHESLLTKLRYMPIRIINKYGVRHWRYLPKWWYQRIRLGVSDRDLWSLDSWLAGTLGHALLELSVVAHGWPAGDDYPAFQDWQAALYKAGNALILYEDMNGDWYTERYEEIREDARVALYWVADNLGRLWD